MLESETVSVGGLLFAPAGGPLAAILRHMLRRDLAAEGSGGNMCRNLGMFDAECD